MRRSTRLAAGWSRLREWRAGRLCATLLAVAVLAWSNGASCIRTEVVPEEHGRLHDLNFAPGSKEYTNEMPERPGAGAVKGPKPPQPIPLTVKTPDKTPDGPAGAEMLNPLQREKEEVRKYLRAQPAPGKLICTALDPAGRRPLAVRIRVVAADKTVEGMTDAVKGEASFDLPAGRTQVYCAAGEFYTPYTNEIDLKPGENRLEVVLTQVPELSPARFGFATLAFARSARLDTV
ncbi:MAG TPA: hypothetical protein VL860_01650, partial [Planctomycetota bacterium]|nr:hypothetical protein [Planctomycetota bacterium]